MNCVQTDHPIYDLSNSCLLVEITYHGIDCSQWHSYFFPATGLLGVTTEDICGLRQEEKLAHRCALELPFTP